MNNSQTERWAYELIETGRKMQGGIKETAYQIHVENNEFDVIATLDTDSRKANSVAKLIAAAPELLEALKASANYIDILGGVSKDYRALIAKAEGKQA
jgi:hypothetical protein